MTVSVEDAALARLEERLLTERAAQLKVLVAEERDRRDAARAEQARQAEQAEAERECDRLVHERALAMAGVRDRLEELGEAVASLCVTDTELQRTSVQTGRPFRSWRQSAAELAVVVLADSGLKGVEPLGFVPAAVRARLLEQFWSLSIPALSASTESSTMIESTTVARCTVCSSLERAEIERELREGEPLRKIEERHGVSRSALSRHREHTDTAA